MSAEAKAEDKIKIAEMLSGELAKVKEQLSGYDDLKKSESYLREKVGSLERQIEEIQRTSEQALKTMLAENALAIEKA